MGRRSDHTRDELRALILAAAGDIIGVEGRSGLTARALAGRVGYSPGTLYNVFSDIDDVILNLKAETLAGLETRLAALPAGDSTEDRAEQVALAYVAYVTENPTRWALIFEHRLPEGRDVPDWYKAHLAALFGLVEDVLRPAFPDPEHCSLAARTLWSSLHGICSLALSGSLALVTPTGSSDMARMLVRTFLKGAG